MCLGGMPRPRIDALTAGRRLPVPRDLLPALLQWLRAIAVVAPWRQECAIAGPQSLETNRALPAKGRWDGAAGAERWAAPRWPSGL
jgi:hypothetical protein